MIALSVEDSVALLISTPNQKLQHFEHANIAPSPRFDERTSTPIKMLKPFGEFSIKFNAFLH